MLRFRAIDHQARAYFEGVCDGSDGLQNVLDVKRTDVTHYRAIVGSPWRHNRPAISARLTARGPEPIDVGALRPIHQVTHAPDVLAEALKSALISSSLGVVQGAAGVGVVGVVAAKARGAAAGALTSALWCGGVGALVFGALLGLRAGMRQYRHLRESRAQDQLIDDISTLARAYGAHPPTTLQELTERADLARGLKDRCDKAGGAALLVFKELQVTLALDDFSMYAPWQPLSG